MKQVKELGTVNGEGYFFGGKLNNWTTEAILATDVDGDGEEDWLVYDNERTLLLL